MTYTLGPTRHGGYAVYEWTTRAFVAEFQTERQATLFAAKLSTKH